jgi:protein gp37
MGENTKIEWADHTFSPWSGCQRVSPGCDHCYAAALAKRSPRTFGSWEPGGERKRTSEAYWRQPLAWNRKAEKERKRARVFCASMADVFDNQVPPEWRTALWDLIGATVHLDWLILTKRPENIADMLPRYWGTEGWGHVWLGTTVEHQSVADRRIKHLAAAPAFKRFLSCEPLLGPLDLWPYLDMEELVPLSGGVEFRRCIDWVIAGGESGPGARPMHPDWARGLRDQCASAGVPFFWKQWGDWRPISEGQDDWYDSLYTPNRLAKDGEDQAALDDTYGRRCTVRKAVIHHDGSVAGVTDAGAWQQGTRAMLTFQVGKKAAGALLDGREHREVPHG